MQDRLDERLAHQSELLTRELADDYNVIIIGAGAIGSFTALALAKMGMQRIEVWDDDKVEEHNLSNQFYPEAAVGKLKVEALADMVRQFTGVPITAVPMRWTGMPPEGQGFFITAVDNMKTRKDAWALFSNSENTVDSRYWFLDPRMGAETMRLYTIDATRAAERKFYERNLYDDSQATPEPCTARTIIYTALLISGLVAGQVKKLLMDHRADNDLVQKEIIYDAKLGIFIAARPKAKAAKAVAEEAF